MGYNNVKKSITLKDKQYHYYSLPDAAQKFGFRLNNLPYVLRIVFENLLRHYDGNAVGDNDLNAIGKWLEKSSNPHEIAYSPARVLMQDFTGVPAIVDLAAMRDAVAKLGGDPTVVNPQNPVDLVIDHSVMVDASGSASAVDINVKREMERNLERYEFLKWGQGAFDNFRVVPPGTGICHQVNLEYLAQIAWTKDVDGETIVYPDTLVGTDSHTTMINGLAVLGWGVGGIEAEAAMLGQPISMLIPDVVGFELKGKLSEGTTATDLVLNVTEMLRAKGVVGKFVEFYGDGLDNLSLADRATIANMAPEYGATCGFFPIDEKTIEYMRLTNRDDERIDLVTIYAKAQGLWRDTQNIPNYSDSLSLNMGIVEASIAGPKRPQDKITLRDAQKSFHDFYQADSKRKDVHENFDVSGKDYQLNDGDIVIAAITSCTNTSNPSVMLAAGLVAQKALEKGLKVKPWVKTSLAPGSQVVSEYLEKSGLQESLDELGFNVVGYGCTTCIGNSGPLDADIDKSIRDNDIFVTSVLSGNRNFEGRVHQLTRGNYLMSPPLVVAYALFGSFVGDITKDAIGVDEQGNDVFLKDIWPSNDEIQDILNNVLTRQMFAEKYSNVFEGTKAWQDIKTSNAKTYQWNDNSTYIQHPPFFETMRKDLDSQQNIKNAAMLALLGDSITTDHISPAGAIAKDSPAADYLRKNNVPSENFNSYGSRRGNHNVMMRGTFANVRIKNELALGTEGGFTSYPAGSADIMPIYDAAMKYQDEERPLVVIAGKEYGTGSSRDWAAKGTNLLGVKAVIVESFERIHRSNLVGMGVLPLQFKAGTSRNSLNLDGTESISIDISNLAVKSQIPCEIKYKNGKVENILLDCRIDTEDELQYYLNGGILHYTIRQLISV